MITTTYQVTGMTCEHCVNAVTSELGSFGGVSGVSVDLVPDGVSRVTVTSSAPLAGAAIGSALDEAGGYQVASGAGTGQSRQSGHPRYRDEDGGLLPPGNGR